MRTSVAASWSFMLHRSKVVANGDRAPSHRLSPGNVRATYQDFRVEAMGLEPTNFLTASHMFGVREGSSSAATGALPGTIVQSRSDRFSGIRPRCLHNCSHSVTPVSPKSRVKVHKRRSRMRGGVGDPSAFGEGGFPLEPHDARSPGV